jgi:hypothetical protein
MYHTHPGCGGLLLDELRMGKKMNITHIRLMNVCRPLGPHGLAGVSSS